MIHIYLHLFRKDLFSKYYATRTVLLITVLRIVLLIRLDLEHLNEGFLLYLVHIGNLVLFAGTPRNARLVAIRSIPTLRSPRIITIQWLIKRYISSAFYRCCALANDRAKLDFTFIVYRCVVVVVLHHVLEGVVFRHCRLFCRVAVSLLFKQATVGLRHF